MDEKVWIGLCAAIATLCGVIGRMYLKSEARWDKLFEDQKSSYSASIAVMQVMQEKALERQAKQYEDQLEIALTDARDYKDMLRQALRSGNTALEVTVEQARRLPSGGDR